MGMKNFQEKAKNLLIETFYILTINLLTLLLPLSFLLLARLSCAKFFLTLTSIKLKQPPCIFSLISFFLNTNPPLLYLLISTISVVTLVHGLTGKLTVLSESSTGWSPYRPRLYTAWIFLCTLQVCVGLGIEGSLAAGIDGSNFGNNERSLLSRVVFFLGLHDTMLLWFRAVVKPVVDDTIFEDYRQERWIERVSMAVTLGSVWWLKLRDEVEALVVVAEAKKELVVNGSSSLEVVDFVGWWLYYLTVTIGMIRVVKGLLWVGMVLLFRRVRRNNSGEACDNYYHEHEDKV